MRTAPEHVASEYRGRDQAGAIWQNTTPFCGKNRQDRSDCEQAVTWQAENKTRSADEALDQSERDCAEK